MSLFDTGIRPVINDYFAKKSEEERDYGDYWSASSAGYCMRLNIMRRLGVPKVPELAEDRDRLMRVFESGHIFHEFYQRRTKEAGISIAQEVELIDDDIMVKGHFDDLCLVDDNLVLYDYKTAHSASFNYKKDKPIGDYHRMQLGTYMYMLRKMNADSDEKFDQLKSQGWTPDTIVQARKLTEARILSISKDDLREDEKQLLWDAKLEKDVYEYWSTLNGYWRDKKLPKCTCDKMDGGFMGRRTAKGKVYNDYYYEDEPCSLKWYEKWKKENEAV